MDDIKQSKSVQFPVEAMEKESDYRPEENTPLLSSSAGKGISIDDALDDVGVGFFHVILILVSGWALASDSVEVLCIGFVSPLLSSNSSNPDLALKPNKVEEGALDGVIFAGMMFGGYFWGSWSDIVGRRSCLITSLTVNALFGLASSLSPTYVTFLIFRFMSGVGVGGSLPVTFSYFCEFFSRKTRGPFVIILASFWTIGQVFAAVVAMAILHNDYIRNSVHADMGLITITPWRVYIMLCTVPCLTAALALLCLPESPSFLYAKGKMDRVQTVLSRIHRVNMLCCWKYKGRSKLDLSTLTPPPVKDNKDQSQSRCESIMKKLLIIFKSTVDLFRLAYLRASLVLIIVFFTFSFGYFGLLLWFPEYFKCVFEQQNNCTFSVQDNRCAPNVTTLCENTGSVYIDSLYTALATIPATVLGIITVNILGGKLMLALSVFICGVSAFLIRIVPPNETAIVALSCVFNGVAIFGWNALDVISTSDLFPVHLRSTALGIQSVFGRVGAILGNLLFGSLITVDPLIPISIVAVVLMFGGVVGFALPAPRGHSLKKNLSRCCCLCRYLGSRCGYCTQQTGYHKIGSNKRDINT